MLVIHHSNKLHKLTDLLIKIVETDLPGVLESEHILVQNPGMKRWLQQQISQTCGIAANLQFPLPSRFIWDIFLSQFEEVETLSAFDGEVLRWQIMSILQLNIDDPKLGILKSYLISDENSLSRFQLAEKLAGLYDQYLVYRPKMILNWERNGATNSSTEEWQAYLWRLIRNKNDKAHRADLIVKLVNHLSSENTELDKLPKRLFVFAISAMSPLYLNVLAALGQKIDVHIFNLNPCEHYWGDIQSKKEQIKNNENPLSENELLASMGKQGRDYIDQLYDSPYATVDNLQFEDIKPDTLLNKVKHDILKLIDTQTAGQTLEDQSIQVVSCYSELRELQVLHDNLLDYMEKDHTLQAHDIVVMCPDINTLAPYVEAVFGQQKSNRKLPYSISDNNNLLASPLLQSIISWLQLPSSRFNVNEILSWLQLPALQRRFDLDDNAVEIIRFWILNNHIHWGLDKSHKQKCISTQETPQDSIPALNLNTWKHGINRLLTAYLMNDNVELYAHSVASESVINQEEFKALGQLQKFLDVLSHWSQKFSKPANLNLWQLNINELIDSLLLLDDDEEWKLKPLRDEIVNWQQQATEAEFNEELDANLIQHILKQAISQGSTHHHYLSGGINFCNLIPMRTLPFKIVCLIGMGDSQFPRNEIPLQLDLISMNPQKGDRSRREDDRYMFLQSLLSAGDRLYISYVGQNKKDDTSLEPSVVVTELIDYIEQTTGYRIPIIKTALQAFSYKNFEAGSYAEQWQLSDEKFIPEAFSQPITPSDSEVLITLEELVKFYKNPAKYFLQQQLNMSLDDNSENIQDDEIFTLDPLSRYSINRELLNELFENKDIVDSKYLNSGKLAELNTGRLQFDELIHKVSNEYQRISGHPEYTGMTYIDGLLKLDNCEISGRVASYSERGLLQVNLSALKGKHIFELWVKHCFLCALEKNEFTEFYYQDKKEKISGFPLLTQQNAIKIMQQLVEGYEQGRIKPLEFYVDTSFEYEKTRKTADEINAKNTIKKLWEYDEYNPFFEAQDVYIKLCLKNLLLDENGFPAEFYRNSKHLMSPLIDLLEHKQ